MIKLCNIPNHIIDISKFDNLLHGKVVTEFEEKFADYVGAKYAASTNSATSALFLSMTAIKVYCQIIHIPTLVTTRFLSVLRNYHFIDDPTWVGGKYKLFDNCANQIYDSAQEVNKNSYKKGLVVYSFYPTKPVSGLCGGMVVSNNEEKIDWIRKAAHFGEDFSKDSWNSKTLFKGWQMFMNSLQAHVALKNLERYPSKVKMLNDIRKEYKKAFGGKVVTGDSNHLFRIRVKDNDKFVKQAYKKGIICGIHYKPAHLDPVYGQNVSLPLSEKDGREVVSIPFHEMLTESCIKKVIKVCSDMI